MEYANTGSVANGVNPVHNAEERPCCASKINDAAPRDSKITWPSLMRAGPYGVATLVVLLCVPTQIVPVRPPPTFQFCAPRIY